LNERGNYSDVQVFTSVFTDSLALGTIIYGTYFLHYNRHYFTSEQLYYYKGVAVAKKPYNERLNLLLEMFSTHVDQTIYTTDSLVIGMPLMTESYEEALTQMDQLPYKTYGIVAQQTHINHTLSNTQTHHMQSNTNHTLSNTNHTLSNTHHTQTNIQTLSKAIFKVKANLAADNYNLYTIEDTLYDTAMVPTYKCSVMLNTLFRKIKENTNLDLLEESDDEEEFENTELDKFVDLEKMVLMECVYSKRFKKWQPMKTVSNHAKIISFRELQHLIKK